MQRCSRLLRGALVFGLAFAAPRSLAARGNSGAAPLPPPPETTPGESDVQALLRRAVGLFDAKHFDEAIALFEEAYAIHPEANYLFNIGRVYEEKGDLEAALTYYERFVAHPEAAPEAKRMTEKRLEQLRAKLPPPSPPPLQGMEPLPEPPPPTVDPTTSSTVAFTDTPPSTPPPRGNLRLRIGGYSVLGGGAAILAIGAGFAGAALAQHRRLDDLSTLETRDDAIRRGEQSSLIADSLFIAGGIVAIAGLTLTLVSLRRRHPAPPSP